MGEKVLPVSPAERVQRTPHTSDDWEGVNVKVIAKVVLVVVAAWALAPQASAAVI